MDEAYTYRGHLVTPIDGATTYGQQKARISGPIVNDVKARANVRLCIDGKVNSAERDAIREGRPPVISPESRRMALKDWAKRPQGSNDDALAAAYHADREALRARCSA